MRYKRKQLITHAVSALLALTLIPLTARAAPDEETPPEISLYDTGALKATLKEHYMGTAGNLTDGTLDASFTPTATATPDGFATDDVIWIGLAMDDFENFVRVRNEGLYNVELAFDYDPAYIAPCDSAGATLAEYEARGDTLDDFNAAWLSCVEDANMKSGAGEKDPDKWDSAVYEFYDGCTAETAVNVNPRNSNPLNTDSALDKMSMLYLDVGRADGASGTSRFKDVTNEDAKANEFYLITLPFRIVNGAEPTETYFALTLGPQTFVMGFGDGTSAAAMGTDSYAAWEDDVSSSEAALRTAINLQTYLTFDGDLFTAAVVADTIRFVLSYDTVETVKTTDDTTGEQVEATPDPDTGQIPTETVTHYVDIYKDVDLTTDSVHGTLSDDDKIVPNGGDNTWTGTEFDIQGNEFADGKITNIAGGAKADIASFAAEVPAEAANVDIEIVKTLRTNDGLSVSFSSNASNYQNGGSAETDDTGGGGSPIASLFKTVELSEYAFNAETNDFSYTNADKGQTATEESPKSMTLSDVNMDANIGFNNMILVSFGGKLYEIYIRKLVEPQIKLNYGNSPVGLIMRDDTKFPTADDKQTAIDAFCENNRFTDENLTPEGGIMNKYYNILAWNQGEGSEDPSVNWDRNEYALFTYLYGDIADPGLAYVSRYNQTQTLDETHYFKRKIEFSYMNANKFPVLDRFAAAEKDSYEDVLNGTESGYTITGLKSYQARLEPLAITYEYVETADETAAVSAERPLIILPKMGDVDINNAVNSNDALAINNKNSAPIPERGKEGTESSNALFEFKVADVDNNSAVNSNDAAAIKNNLVTEMYTPLEDVIAAQTEAGGEEE